MSTNEKALWRRLAMIEDDKFQSNNSTDSDQFFAPTQKPVIVSATAALAWPPGGIRPKDCVERVREKEEEQRTNHWQAGR